MQEKINDVLVGKLKVTDLTPEELPEFVKAANAEAEKTRGEVTGLREAKRAEAERVEKLKKDADAAQAVINSAEAAKSQMATLQGQTTQFRQEQVDKAKRKFVESFKVSAEETVKVEELFKRLDSGKVDADLIYNDFVSSYAAANPEAYIQAKKTLDDLTKGAANANSMGANGSQSSPGGGEPKKFSPEIVELAKQANITPEAAEAVAKQGMSRIL